MLYIATIEDIRQFEQEADANGLSYAAMMDAAGGLVADHVLESIKDIQSPQVAVLVGSGNNGGDGLVAARILASQLSPSQINIYLLKARDDDHIVSVREAGCTITIASEDTKLQQLKRLIEEADIIIDALFGIGISLPLRDEAREILQTINAIVTERQRSREAVGICDPAKVRKNHRRAVRVVAVDCPSGLDCNTGDADPDTLQADETITFIAIKPGQLHFPGAGFVGRLLVADIGVEAVIDMQDKLSGLLVDYRLVSQLLPARSANSHKGTYGQALIVAGSVNYIGAPALAAEAAYRSGAGLVTVATASNVIAALAGALKEPTWMMLPHDMGVIAERATEVIADELARYKAILIGPGLGTDKATRNFLVAFLNQPQNQGVRKPRRKIGFQIQDEKESNDTDIADLTMPPLVVDADGLNLLADVDEWWTIIPENTIITPHPGEMARLTGLDIAEIQTNRWEIAREKATTWNVIVLLKGAHTVIAAPDGRFAVLPFKTDSLATAGTGDILAGLIVGMLAQGIQPFDAALIAGYVHGLAGTIASDGTSTRSVIAGDILQTIGEAFHQIEG